MVRARTMNSAQNWFLRLVSPRLRATATEGSSSLHISCFLKTGFNSLPSLMPVAVLMLFVLLQILPRPPTQRGTQLISRNPSQLPQDSDRERVETSKDMMYMKICRLWGILAKVCLSDSWYSVLNTDDIISISAKWMPNS